MDMHRLIYNADSTNPASHLLDTWEDECLNEKLFFKALPCCQCSINQSMKYVYTVAL